MTREHKVKLPFDSIDWATIITDHPSDSAKGWECMELHLKLRDNRDSSIAVLLGRGTVKLTDNEIYQLIDRLHCYEEDVNPMLFPFYGSSDKVLSELNKQGYTQAKIKQR